jgi:hypothetical protein
VEKESGRSCGTNGGEEPVLLLVRKPEGKRQLGRPRSKCVHNIKTDIEEIEWNVVVWIGQAQDMDKWRALVNAVVNLGVP